MNLEIKKLQVQLAHITAARLANELRVEELLESIERIKKDIDISNTKELELSTQIKEKQGI